MLSLRRSSQIIHLPSLPDHTRKRIEIITKYDIFRTANLAKESTTKLASLLTQQKLMLAKDRLKTLTSLQIDEIEN